jgi:hypothetical protein
VLHGAVGAEVVLREDAQREHVNGVEGEAENAPASDIIKPPEGARPRAAGRSDSWAGNLAAALLGLGLTSRSLVCDDP